MASGCSFVDLDFLKQSKKIRNLGGGTFGSVALYSTPIGDLAVKKTKLGDKSLGYPYDLLAEIDMLIKLQSLNNVVRLRGISFNFNRKQGYMLLEPLDGSLSSWAKGTSYDQRIKYLPKLIFEIGQVLTVMHELSLIHNDIKTNNILVEETKKGPTFKLADFGKSGYVSNPNIPYGGITKYKPPSHRNIYFSEMWAFMICCVEVILGGRRLVDEENIKKFYHRNTDQNGFNLKGILNQRITQYEYDKIPNIFWNFTSPIVRDKKVSLYKILDHIGITVSNHKILQVKKDMSVSEPTHPKLEIILNEYRDKIKRVRREVYFDRFVALFNKFLHNVPKINEINNITLHYYAEVAYIIIVKGKATEYEYFKNQQQFLEFERAFLTTVGYQTLVI